MDSVSRSTGKVIGNQGIKWGGKTLLNLEYADDISIPRVECEQNE